ncbi:hypothetical protein CGC56_10060 [Capnocytophaga canimorsus]|uniref:Knr4/Smi1-like domain-containing protein n=1 Tax=Capnocytophaga canimorsus TaxID=28188 RepID=A0A250G5I7_9FLAO|nr:SMI1/KNR4 family protein [Capnocytophaga canimorsus]ATA92471.1 hypothetical protein CGC56_10060 [Capnocytophaga canimorsus]
MELKKSFPKLNDELLKKVERILAEKFDYKNIPSDYKNFLLKNNGGYVSPGFVDDSDTFKHRHEIVFNTPLKWNKDNNRPVTPTLVSFFAVWLEEDMNGNEVEDWNLPELILSNEHSKYDFDVLPDKMMSIGKCEHPDAADMLCLSLDKQDYGAVYYYYGMCDHPALFHGDFYQKASDKVVEKYGLSDEDLYNLDEDNPQDRTIINELKKAVFVKVANSFSEFLDKCKIAKVEDLYA